MNRILFVLALLSSSVYANDLYTWKVDHLIDGDTVAFHVDFLPAPLKPVLSVRVDGVDTPEKKPRSKCAAENLLAQKASLFTKESIANAKTVQVSLRAWDKYGGRVLGDIIIDGKSLSSMLIEGGYAREYHGEAKKSWCN